MTRDRAMRLTAPGWGALAAAFITLSAAAVSGNNLLYLLFATILAAFVLSWAAGKANLRPVVAGLSAPGQIFRGSEFSLKVILENRGRLPVLGLRLACRGQRRPVESLAAGGKAELELRYLLPHRGRNRPEDLRLESEFPFALLLHSRPLAAPELTALPRTPEIRSAAELGAGVEVLVSSAARRARSGDLWGVREMRADDDIRAVNWKLSAKAGRLMAVEYAEAAGARVTVRLEAAAAGPAGEQRVEEAAGACRFFIDSGAEVRLVMPGGGVDYGRGLLHLDRLLWALALAGDGAAARPAVHPDPAPAGAPADEALRRRLVLLGCWTVYACLLLIEEFRGSPAVLAAALLAGGAFAPQRGKGAPPARFWDAVSLAVLLYSVLFHWRQAGIMVANTWLVAYLLVYFAFNPGDRSARWRAYIVFYIGFFLVSGQTVSPLYLPAYLAFLAFSTAWMAAEWGAGLRSGRGWHRVLAAVMAAEFALAAAAFAVIPRIEPLGRRGPIAASLGWDKLRARSQAVTGFTTTVSLGYFGEIRRSSARVMRVKPLKPPPGPPPPLYVRAMAFDSFDGRRWYKGGRDLRYRLGGRLYWRMEGGAPMRRSGGLLVFPGAPAAAPASAAEYTIYPINLGVIFSAYPVVSVERPDGGAFFDYTDSAYFPAPYLAGITYTVNGSSGAPAEGAMALVEDPGKLLRLHLGVPAAADPRIAALARDLTLNRSDALSKVRAVEKHLRSSYEYSLFSEGEETSLADFLFKTREGNCEYFATAAAVLLRYAGVPTRLVTGFLAGEFNEYGGFYDVRQSQAHAWVEAHIPGLGWVRLDPTPPAASESLWARSLAGRAARWFEAGHIRWYRHVIGYDTYVQRNTFRRLGLAVSGLDLARTLGWVGSAAAAALLLRAAVLAWPRRRARPAAGDIFSRAQAALEAAGLRREPHWTPREYALWVAARRPDLSGITRLAEEHYLERYAGRPRTAAELAAAQQILEELLRSKTGAAGPG